MKLNKIIAAAALILSGFSTQAQETVTEYNYIPNWYIQGQFGAQETLGEAKFSELLSPNAQVGVGYNFCPYIGTRLSLNAWQSKAASDIHGILVDHEYRWKWNYVAPSLDVMFNMTNVLGGFNPNRLVDVYVYGGVGMNFASANGEANDAEKHYQSAMKSQLESSKAHLLGNLWDGSKSFAVGRFGSSIDFNLTKNLALGAEVSANVLSDKYNSKRAGNADWYFNGLIGVKYTFGAKSQKVTRTIPAPEPVVVEKIIEKVVEKIVEVPVKEQVVAAPEELRRNIFFKIATTNIAGIELDKVTEVADFLKNHPASKVVITGYADRGTGTPAINDRLCKQRAQAVANLLTGKYGIEKSRIVVKSMTATESEPFSNPAENRVAIAICE